MSNGKHASFPQFVAAKWGRTSIGSEGVPQYTFICFTRIKGLLHSWLFPQGSVCHRLVVMMLLDVLAVTQRHVTTIQRPPLHRPSPAQRNTPTAPHLRNFTPGAPLPPETSPPPAPETSSEQRPFQGLPRPPRSKDPSKGPPWTPRGGEEGTKSKVEGGGGGGEGGFAIFFHRGQLQSNLLTESHRSGKNRMKIEPHTNATIRQPHPARPTKRHSRSTSCGGSVSQPEPRAPGSSNMEEATARAAAHAINEPHRRRHACSTRRPINCVSLHAFAVANWVLNACVSLDHRPTPLRAPGPPSELGGDVRPAQVKFSHFVGELLRRPTRPAAQQFSWLSRRSAEH